MSVVLQMHRWFVISRLKYKTLISSLSLRSMKPATSQCSLVSFTTSDWTAAMPSLKKLCKFIFVKTWWKNSANFDNFWHKGSQEAKIMRGAIIYHFIRRYFMSLQRSKSAIGTNYSVPHARTNLSTQPFFVAGSIVWNSIPVAVHC